MTFDSTYERGNGERMETGTYLVLFVGPSRKRTRHVPVSLRFSPSRFSPFLLPRFSCRFSLPGMSPFLPGPVSPWQSLTSGQRSQFVCLARMQSSRPGPTFQRPYDPDGPIELAKEGSYHDPAGKPVA